MSQKFIKKKQTSPKSLGYGKYYAKAVYNQKHITTRQLADFIQTQASVKRSDCIAVLDELGYALRHFIGLGEKVKIEDFIQTQASVKRSDCIAVLDELGYALRHFIGLGEKVKIENVGIFKCGVRNKRGGFEDAKDLTASTLSPRILFQPEYTTSTQNGVTRAAVAMLGDITFEEATDYEAPKEEKPAGTGD